MNPKRSRRGRGRRRLLTAVGLLVLGMMGCGSDPNGPDLNPDFMVGDWVADELLMTSQANPNVTADLIALGATFTLLVQPSGRYTAILEGFGQSSSEIGELTVDGADVVLMPSSPPGPESRAVWTRDGDSVTLVGDSEFDFNLDLTPEPAILRQVLIPR